MNTLCAVHLPSAPPPRLATLATPHRRLGILPCLLRKKHRPTLGPLRPNVFTAVRNFLRCGDLASAFLRFHCSDCGHERILAFTCKGRHLCPACHQRRVRQTADWSATAVCHEVPHRQFVFTIPKILRGIFRKRRAEYLLRHPFSLQKITWNPTTQTVIYRSKRHHTTKRNFEIFKAPFFPALRSGHQIFQRPPSQKQILAALWMHRLVI